jgi:hypothetical protein
VVPVLIMRSPSTSQSIAVHSTSVFLFDVVTMLIRAATIQKTDIIGEQVHTLVDGSKIKSYTFQAFLIARPRRHTLQSEARGFSARVIVDVWFSIDGEQHCTVRRALRVSYAPGSARSFPSPARQSSAEGSGRSSVGRTGGRRAQQTKYGNVSVSRAYVRPTGIVSALVIR